MSKIDLNHDGELIHPEHLPVREIMQSHPIKRKSKLWRYATFWLMPLTSFVGVEVALYVVGPVIMMLVIALFSFSPI